MVLGMATKLAAGCASDDRGLMVLRLRLMRRSLRV